MYCYLSFFITRGESVSELSTTARKRLYGDDNILGDRVDMQILTKIGGAEYDLVNGEFVNAKNGLAKFSSDHRKLLREAKIILDTIANNNHITQKEIKRLLIPCFQATGFDGELMVLKLFAPGLYSAQYMGSVTIPDHVSQLKLLRKKALPRLFYIKVKSLFTLLYFFPFQHLRK